MPPPAMPPPAMPQPPMPSLPTTRANPAAVAVGLAGGVVLVVSVFLALADNTTSYGRIAADTLIQHGGWPLVVLGVAAVLAAIRSTATGKPSRRTFLVLGLLAIAFVIYVATDKSVRTIYPQLLNGAPDTSQPGTVAGVGIGVYVAAIGAGLVLLASLFGSIPIAAANAVAPPSLAESRSYPPPSVEPTKKCPDCAETILRDAHVCKHCGYRFGPASPPTT